MKQKNKVIVTLNLKIFLSISSLIMFIFGIVNVLDSFLYAVFLIIPFSLFYVVKKGVLVFPCYLIIDAHFFYWLYIFLSGKTNIWPTSIVMTLYFGYAIFKRKKNFMELTKCLL
jgi:hypothetical protein